MKGLLLSLLLLPTLVSAQDRIGWKAERKLTWADFTGKPDRSTNLMAVTDSGMSIGMDCDGGSPKANVVCYFTPSRSWYKQGCTEALLRHEQLHFDITELFARKLRKELAAMTDCRQMGKAIGPSHNRVFDDCNRYQDQYDHETRHSTVAEAQQQWEKKVAQELAELHDWASH